MSKTYSIELDGDRAHVLVRGEMNFTTWRELTRLISRIKVGNMDELHKALEDLVVCNGKEQVIDALIEVFAPAASSQMTRSNRVLGDYPELDHYWEVLKAAKLAMSDQRFVVRVEVDVPQRRGRLGYCGKGSST